MQKKWTPLNVIGLLFASIGFVSIIVSFLQEGNGTFLNIGLSCTCVSMLLVSINNFKKRNK